MRRVLAAIALGLLAGTSQPLTAQPVNPAPAVGDAVLTDRLIGPALIIPTTCPTNKGGTLNTADGTVYRTTGACTEGARIATSPITRLADVTLGDGDVTFEAKVLAGADRAGLRISFRENEERTAFYFATLSFSGLPRYLDRVSPEDDGQPRFSRLAEHVGGQNPMRVDEWNTVSVRARGELFWVIVNGEVILHGADDMLGGGRVALSALRAREDDSGDEVSIIVRNLRVSRLEGPNSAATTTYQPRPILGALDPPLITLPLTPGGAVGAQACPTGRGGSSFVEGVYRVSLTGPCLTSSSSTQLTVHFSPITMRDGEASIEFKVAAGRDRVLFNLIGRSVPTEPAGYLGTWLPRTGHFAIMRAQGSAVTAIARRDDAAAFIRADEWNTLSIRVHGSTVAMSINGQLVLAGADTALDGGTISLYVARSGGDEDTEEVAILLRNLRVSAFSGGDADRKPVVTVSR
jgi:hypothetical protein